jgi:hypothetical protein
LYPVLGALPLFARTTEIKKSGRVKKTQKCKKKFHSFFICFSLKQRGPELGIRIPAGGGEGSTAW